MRILKSLWLRLKYAWQRIRRGYGDDEIDWELRAKLEREAQAEMEAAWGPGLADLKNQVAQLKTRAEIIGDESLPEQERLEKVRSLFPDFTESQFHEQLSSMRIDREATLIARDRHLNAEHKVARIARLYPNMERESIRARIEELESESD